MIVHGAEPPWVVAKIVSVPAGVVEKQAVFEVVSPVIVSHDEVPSLVRVTSAPRLLATVRMPVKLPPSITRA